MPRSGEEARRRLQRVALELFREQGFDRTTTAEIARHAGVTERTYFHHFRDKREVLFGGEEVLRGLLIAAVRDAPHGPAPLEVLLGAFLSVEDWMEDGRAYARPRYDVVAASPALRERETAKLASLAGSVADALVERGVGHRRATITARAAMAAFEVATVAWYADPSHGFGAHLRDAFDDLRTLGGAD